MQHPINYLLTQPEYNRLLVNSVPDIKRCQEWYLYDYNGNKILDLYAANTRSMFGHKPLSVSKLIKQRINQGLWSSIPVRSIRDFMHRCKQLFPKYRYYCFAPSLRDIINTFSSHPYYRNAHWIDAALPSSGARGDSDQHPCIDNKKQQSANSHTAMMATNAHSSSTHHQNTGRTKPLSSDSAAGKVPTVGIGRVFCSIPQVDILLPIIPHPDEGVPQIIATSDEKIYTLFCNSTLPGGVTLAALLEMVKYFEPRYHYNALRHTNRADYITPPLSASDLPSSIWILHERYLWSKLTGKQYKHMYDTMLAHNILIHPNPNAPSILPFRMPNSDYLRFLEITARISRGNL